MDGSLLVTLQKQESLSPRPPSGPLTARVQKRQLQAASRRLTLQLTQQEHAEELANQIEQKAQQASANAAIAGPSAQQVRAKTWLTIIQLHCKFHQIATIVQHTRRMKAHNPKRFVIIISLLVLYF